MRPRQAFASRDAVGRTEESDHVMGESRKQRGEASSTSSAGATGLAREMGLLGLAATGICSMMGAAINVIPFMIQRSVPGIGPYVLPAYLFAALPAVFAALAYAILASAMPRAGGIAVVRIVDRHRCGLVRADPLPARYRCRPWL